MSTDSWSTMSRVPSIVTRDSAHAAALPIAPAPARTTLPMVPRNCSRNWASSPSPTGFNLASRSREASGTNTDLKTLAAAKHAASPGPNGISVSPQDKGPFVETCASQPFDPTKMRLMDDAFRRGGVPMMISTLGVPPNSIRGLMRVAKSCMSRTTGAVPAVECKVNLGYKRASRRTMRSAIALPSGLLTSGPTVMPMMTSCSWC